MNWYKIMLFDKEAKKKLLPNVKNQVLLQLGALAMTYFFDDSAEEPKAIAKRAFAKGHTPNRSGIAFELQPSDVMELLECSEKRAKELLSVLRAVTM